MKKARMTAARIIGILHEHEAGVTCAGPFRNHGMLEGTFHAWKAKHPEKTVSEATRLSGLVLARRQPKMGANVIRSSKPGWIINRRLERRRAHRSDATDCHEASAKFVILGQAQQGSMQIGESRLHGHVSGHLRTDAQFE